MTTDPAESHKAWDSPSNSQTLPVKQSTALIQSLTLPVQDASKTNTYWNMKLRQPSVTEPPAMYSNDLSS